MGFTNLMNYEQCLNSLSLFDYVEKKLIALLYS